MATVFHFVIDQGSPVELIFEVKLSDGLPQPLTGYTAQLQARVGVGDAVTVIDKMLDVATGGLMSHEMRLRLTSAETAALTFATAVYDVEVITPSNRVRVVQGTITLSREVTR